MVQYVVLGFNGKSIGQLVATGVGDEFVVLLVFANRVVG